MPLASQSKLTKKLRHTCTTTNISIEHKYTPSHRENSVPDRNIFISIWKRVCCKRVMQNRLMNKTKSSFKQHDKCLRPASSCAQRNWPPHTYQQKQKLKALLRRVLTFFDTFLEAEKTFFTSILNRSLSKF